MISRRAALDDRDGHRWRPQGQRVCWLHRTRRQARAPLWAARLGELSSAGDVAAAERSPGEEHVRCFGNLPGHTRVDESGNVRVLLACQTDRLPA
jgi:hypothetical protein